MPGRFDGLEHEVCNCLRWKSIFYESVPDPTVPPPSDDNYWCALTQRILGPDDQLVEPESCKLGRSCFRGVF